MELSVSHREQDRISESSLMQMSLWEAMPSSPFPLLPKAVCYIRLMFPICFFTLIREPRHSSNQIPFLSPSIYPYSYLLYRALIKQIKRLWEHPIGSMQLTLMPSNFDWAYTGRADKASKILRICWVSLLWLLSFPSVPFTPSTSNSLINFLADFLLLLYFRNFSLSAWALLAIRSFSLFFFLSLWISHSHLTCHNLSFQVVFFFISWHVNLISTRTSLQQHLVLFLNCSS